MKIIATQKYFRMTPRKLRLVASIAKKMEPEEAIAKLPFLKKRAKEPIIKVIKTALANGKVKGFTPDQLEFDEIQICEGPRLKRGRAVSRGRWHPYQRKMSHIRIVLKTKEGSDKKTGKQKKTVGTEKVVKEKTKKISLDQISKLRSNKGEGKQKADKEIAKGQQKTARETIKDRKSVRTTHK
ncbi:hypothetical protein JXA63_02420 [Candidatus Woesebacteria bacterium]|nr:hypothetical protein [Candidatus Woesebacteria bacterium]